jgi:WD40 repeat protein
MKKQFSLLQARFLPLVFGIAAFSATSAQRGLAQEPKERTTLKAHTADVNSVAFAPDGKTPELFTLDRHTRPVQGVAYSKDGKLATASVDGKVMIWDAATGQYLRTLTGHAGSVRAVAFSPDDRQLASAGGADGTVKLWEPDTGRLIRTLRHSELGVLSVAFGPDGKWLAAASEGFIAIYEVAGGAKVFGMRPQNNVFCSVVFSLEGQVFISRGGKCDLLILTPAAKPLISTDTGHDGAVWGLAISADGRLLASAGVDQTVRLRNLRTDEHKVLRGHRESVLAVAFSPDGKYLASGSMDATVKIWETASGREVRTLTGHLGGVYCVAFSPDGRRLASGSGSDRRGELKVWDMTESLHK